MRRYFWVLLVFPLASAQWFDPWISKPSPGSPSYDFITDLTLEGVNSQIFIKEDIIPGRGSIAQLHYNGSLSLLSCSAYIFENPLNSYRPNGVNLTLVAVLDYEGTKTYECFMLLSSTAEVHRLTVNVVDVNDNTPFFESGTNTTIRFEENKSGPVYDFRATDADEGDNPQLEYILQVISGDSQHFEMLVIEDEQDPTRKICRLRVKEGQELDYETNTFFVLSVTAKDPVNHRSTIQVALQVIDMDDQPPEWSKEVPLHRMEENLPIGTELFTVQARDRDRGINNPISYTIQDPTGTFGISSTTGLVSLLKLVDREELENPNFEVLIIATEISEIGRQSETTTTIIVLDVNDNDPYFEVGTSFNFSVPENTNRGFFIGAIRAFDLDLDNIITYTFEACNNDGLDYVEIRPSTGQILVKESIDYEMVKKFNCTIRITDSGKPPRWTDGQLDIHIIDVNDNEPIFGDIQIDSIPENAPNGTRVGRVSASDADSGEFGKVTYLYYRINTEGGDQFEIDPDSGEIRVRLINGAELDFETKAQFTFNIEVRDYYRPNIITGSNSNVTSVTVRLTDVNDNAPVLPPDSSSCFFSISERASQGDSVGNIRGTDADERDTPKSQINYEMLSQVAIFPTPDLQGDIFNIATVNNVGEVKVAAKNLGGYYGNYTIDVLARDFGVPPLNSTQTYTVCVLSYNEFAPVFTFPGSVTEVNVFENSTVGAILLYKYGEEMRPLKFEATDEDKGPSGEIVKYEWTPGFSNPTSVFQLENDGSIRLLRPFVRNTTNSYSLSVRALDGGEPNDASSGGQKFTDATLDIKVRLVSQFRPEFAGSTSSLNFFENRLLNVSFPAATDKDDVNLLPEETPEKIYYYVIDGNNKLFSVRNREAPILSNLEPLDREDPIIGPPHVLFVIIEASNDFSRPTNQDCSQIDCTLPSYLNISIIIDDENDNPPTFPGTFSGGIKDGDKRDKVILTITSTDPDLNDNVTYTLSPTVNVSDSSLSGYANNPFRIRPVTNELLLNFDVQATMKGFFGLNVTAIDAASNQMTTEIKVYVVVTDNQVFFVFDNEKSLVEKFRTNIEDIFTDVYNYRCTITDVEESTIEESQTVTNVYSYFVDEAQDQPVLSSVIEVLKTNSSMTKELDRQFISLGLYLKEIKSINETPDAAQQLFMILFILACILLAILLALLIVMIIRGTDLNRKVKALSSTKFGSQDSAMNRVGMTVPNTNLHAIEGSNPIWSVEGNLPQDDNISESSGDSILIGVEDNPEFRGFKGHTNRNYHSESAPMPFQNVARRNPLADVSRMNDSPDQSPLEERKVKRPAPPPPLKNEIPSDQDSDFGEDENYERVDSNFSFGGKLTSM